MLLQMLSYINNPLMLIAFIFLLIIPLLFSLAFHELAHGYVAYKFGDPTAKAMGRLTLNPFKHLDVAGTILLFVIGLGWAKPVPVNILNIPNRTQQMLVALAGPLSNIILAVLCAILLMLFTDILPTPFLQALIRINLGLAVFNLLPIPPLDGSRILTWLLPQSVEEKFQRFENYGFAILLLIMFTIGFNWIFKIVNILQKQLYIMLGI